MKKFCCLILTLLMFVLPIGFCGCTKIKKRTTTITENYTLFENFCYGTGERNMYDLCLPKTTGDVGLVLCIHGGGWVEGNKNGYVETLKKWANQGVACASINYRYASKQVTGSNILDDITSALQAIKIHASGYNINLTKVLLTGGSAGGHLSLLYAYAKNDVAPIKPACVVSLSGPTNLIDENYYNNNKFQAQIYDMFTCLIGKNFSKNTISNVEGLLTQMSPTNYVNKNTVPTVVAHGKVDELVPYSNAVYLDELLTECEVEHSLITFENSGHGLENDPTQTQQLNNLMQEYVNKYLK